MNAARFSAAAFIAASLVSSVFALENPRLIQFWDDASTEISTIKTYTHVVNFGRNNNYANAVVNGVPFHKTTAATGNMPAPRQHYGWENFPPTNTHDGGSTNNVASPVNSGIHNVLFDMIYALPNNETMCVTGLQPGFIYEIRFFNRVWGTGGNDRWQTFTFMPNDEDPGDPNNDFIYFNQDDTTLKDNMLAYQYKAGTNGVLAIRVVARNTGNSWHCYGFTNEEVGGVNCLPATNLGMTSADLRAKVTFTNTLSSVVAHWAYADGGRDAGAWAAFPEHKSAAASYADGVWSVQASPLLSGSNYVYRFAVTFGGETVWSPPATLTTKTVLPEIEMLGVTVPSTAGITANVRLIWPGATPDATLTLYWGAEDEGDEINDWMSNHLGSVVLSNRAAGDWPMSFSVPAENTPYYLRVFATSGAHTAATASTVLFMVETMTASQLGTLYWGGGTADITPLTAIPTAPALLSGTWGGSRKNWSVDELGSQYVAWGNGEKMVAILPRHTPIGNSYITLETDLALNQLRMISVTDWDRYYFETPVARTLLLTGKKPELNITGNQYANLYLHANIKLEAPGGFFKSGGGTLNVYGNADGVVGEVPVQGVLQMDGTMNSVTKFVIQTGSRLVATLADQVNNKLHPNAEIRLHGMPVNSVSARFQPAGNNGGTQGIGKISLDSSGRLELQAARGVFHLNAPAGIDRGYDGKGVLLLEGDGAGFLHPNIVVHNGVDTGVLLPWAYTTMAQPVKLNNAKQFEVIPTVDAPDDLEDWKPGLNYRYTGKSTPDNTLTNTAVASLDIYNSGAFNLNIEPGHTLDITSGHLASYPVGSGGTKLITGGKLTSSSDELYVMTGEWGHMGLVEIRSEITGENMDLIKSGALNLVLSGPSTNSYKGVTYINGGTLLLSKTFPQTGIPGDVVINRHGKLESNTVHDNGYSTNTNFTLREGGEVSHRDSVSQTVNGTVTFEGGRFSFGAGNGALSFTHPGGFGLDFKNGGDLFHSRTDMAHGLNILTNVRCGPASSNQAFIVSNMTPRNETQRMNLTNGAVPATRLYEIHKAFGLEPGQPELTISFILATAAGGDVHLEKTGAGAMALEKVSGQFRGKASVLGGALYLNAYVTQTVMTASIHANYGTTFTNLSASTAGLVMSQPLEGVGGRVVDAWINGFPNANAVSFTPYIWDTPRTNTVTFLACGPLGRAELVVDNGGTLGGTGGHGGNVEIKTGGAFSPGTPAKPVSEFQIDGGLKFNPDSVWQVDIDATSRACDRVHVTGSITLDGAIMPVFHNSAKPRPKGVWTIATYGIDTVGKMAAPQGCRVRVDEEKKEVLFISSEAGTLLMVR